MCPGIMRLRADTVHVDVPTRVASALSLLWIVVNKSRILAPHRESMHVHVYACTHPQGWNGSLEVGRS